MKELNTYIIEKLRINDDTKLIKIDTAKMKHLAEDVLSSRFHYENRKDYLISEETNGIDIEFIFILDSSTTLKGLINIIVDQIQNIMDLKLSCDKLEYSKNGSSYISLTVKE